MILDRIQRYLGMTFLTALIITQASVFVAVKASNNSDLLRAIFVEPVNENISIGDSIYFQAMLSNQEDSQFDLVYFNLKNLATGLDENYQASLQTDGSWLAQSIWNTSYNYQPGEYYLSVVAHDNSQDQNNIYYSQTQVINLVGELEIAADLSPAHFSYPTISQIINRDDTPSLEAILYIPNNTINDFSNSQLRFVLLENHEEIDGGITQLEFSFPELAVFDGISPDGNYRVWKSTIILDSSILDGEYSLMVNNYSGIDQFSELEVEPLNFTITSTTPTEGSVDEIAIDVLSPSNLEQFLLTDNLPIEVLTNKEISTGSKIGIEIISSNINRSSLISERDLERDINNPLLYTTVIDLDAATIPGEEGAQLDLVDNYALGKYEISFFLITDGQKLGLQHVNFNIVADQETEVISKIILNSPEIEAGLVEGNMLDLNFETSFETDAFLYTITKDGDSTLGLDTSLPVSNGLNWQVSIEAIENKFTNGTYILTAHANGIAGETADFGPVAFDWQITEEDILVDPSLTIYITDTNLGPRNILIGSGNILESDFVLENTINEEVAYRFSPTLVDCADSSIISQSIQDLAVSLGQGYCFYYVLEEDGIANGNYYLYLQKESSSNSVVVSNKELVSYFDSGDIESLILPEDVILKVSVDAYNSLIVNSNWDTPLSLGIGPFIIWENIDTGNVIATATTRLDYLTEDNQAILMPFINEIIANNSDAPYIFIAPNINLQDLPDGEYNVYAGYNNSEAFDSIESENRLNITVANQNIEIAPVDEVADISVDEIAPVDEVADISVDEIAPVDETENLTIDFYSTCYEEGITDKETCARFRATMDLLDPTCIEQNIYDNLACEDYLYRIETDLECQENNIIDKEQCKNYLLEKYGSQVDCQLTDANLCNSILRNKYLNRLVSGQRLSQNINQAVDSLFGESISTQELSDVLEDNGIDSQAVLPLSPNQNTKVLLSKSQKETVLEEEDRLTILNQAIIILDADGDGLSDDLETYYGTEINNPDTDGDGYSDGEEITNGYDPIGPGKLIKDRTNFDIVTLDKDKAIEQPKIKSKKIDNTMEVFKVDVQENKLSLSGKAAANTWVNLYLYSGLPLVMTTKTDASGNWSYNIKDSLTDGHHRVFVTVNDDTGRIVKQSRPISFLIKEAQAVTVDDYFDTTSSSEANNNLFIYYILGGAFLVFLALGVIIFLHKGKNSDLEI